MRLTALCICGTLLAFTSLSWTSADDAEGALLGVEGFGPCTATLRPVGLCRQRQDDSTCPYLLSLPPLTVHLPKQLSELEDIMKDLQKLKENVDQLKKMCADCTVSQSERACGRERESRYENLSEGKDERYWMNERIPERPQDNDRDLRQKCGSDGVKPEAFMEGDGESEKMILREEKEKKNWEEERDTSNGVVDANDEKEALNEASEKDGKTQEDGAKGENTLRESKVPDASGKDKAEHLVRQKAVDKIDKETGRDKEDEKRNLKGDEKSDHGKEGIITIDVTVKEKTKESDHHVWQDETQEADKNTQTEEDRGHDQTKMSEDHDRHTNKEREQHREERIKEVDGGIKVEQNNEKPKQTEIIGRTEKKKPIKGGELEEDSEAGKRIKTEGEKAVQSEQRDSDGELASSKAIEGTDFVSISPIPQSTISLTQRLDSMDLDEATTITSSLPSPPVSSSTSHFITEVIEGVTLTAYGVPTPNTDLGPPGDTEHTSAYEGSVLRASTLATTAPRITSATTRFTTTTRRRLGAHFQDKIISTMAATVETNLHQSLHTAIFTAATEQSHWSAKKNISSNTTSDIKPPAGQGPKPGENHKPGIKPEADHKPKYSKYDNKPDHSPLPDIEAKQDQNPRPSQQNPTADPKPEPGKDAKEARIPKPDQRHLPYDIATDENLKTLMPKHDQERSTNQNQIPIQKQSSHQKSGSVKNSETVNTTGSDKKPGSDEIPIFNPNLKLEEKTLNTSTSDQNQKTDKKLQSEEKSKPDQDSESNKHVSSAEKPESEKNKTISHTLKPNQKTAVELMESTDQYASPEPKSTQESTPAQKLTPNPDNLPPDQTPDSDEKISTPNQKPGPSQLPKLNQKHTKFETDLETKPNVKPKLNQPQTNQGLKKPQPDHRSDLNPKSVSDQDPDAESNKTSKEWPPPRRRLPTGPIFKPRATPAKRPRPVVQSKPNPQTQTHTSPPRFGRTTTDSIQNTPTYRPPTSSSVKQIVRTTQSPEDTEFSLSTIKTSQDPNNLNSLEAAPLPHLQAIREGFTVSPITSDLRPQTPAQQPSVPMTTTPNKIIHEIHSVIPSTSPGSTKLNLAPNGDPHLQAKIPPAGEKTAPSQMSIPVPSPSAKTTSTDSSDFRSTTQATSGPKVLAVEASTPSTRELRVKINQVAAFLNNSLGPKGRPPGRHPKEHLEDQRGGGQPDRTDTKAQTPTPSKVSRVTRDCSDLSLKGAKDSGVYLVTPDLRSRSFPVSCDMDLDGGGWTILQRRQDGSVNFNRTWADYQSGFGELNGGEFWLGNHLIHLLTRERDMVLRVELEDFNGVKAHAQYERFMVASERLRYRLTVGGYSGTAGDALRFSKMYDHNNRAFTTPDRDHDRYPSGNCGVYYSSGWWFDACMAANLNGRYYVGKYKGVRDGIFWGTWHNISTEYYPTSERQSFKRVRMLIRPKGFVQ